jgi:hypothetical protein
MWPIGRAPQWVDRVQELAILHAGIEALGRGEGAVVWVEGEPGIGKSSLVAEALAAASQPGWDVGWGMADQLTEQLPLRVMLDCLQVRPGSPDPRRAHAAGLLRSRRLGLFGDVGSGSASTGRLDTSLDYQLERGEPVGPGGLGERAAQPDLVLSRLVGLIVAGFRRRPWVQAEGRRCLFRLDARIGAITGLRCLDCRRQPGRLRP